LYILGINAYHGDAAAAIVCDGALIAAVEEERFNRVKHCAGFPTQSIEYCLRAAGISIEQVEHVGISRKPAARLHKKLFAAGQRLVNRKSVAVAEQVAAAGVLSSAPHRHPAAVIDQAIHSNGGNGKHKQFTELLKDRLRNAARVYDLRSEVACALGVSTESIAARTHHIEHHRAHLASAYHVSPFERAALLSLDGFGDFVSTMWGVGAGKSIKVLGQVEYPHSLGILYTATTQFLGFHHYGDEGKVMGLAPYGKPRFIDHFRQIVKTQNHGKFQLDLGYFRHASQGVDMSWEDGSPQIGQIFSDGFAEEFGQPRSPNSELSERDCDIAASLQLRLEEVAFHVLNHLYDQTRVTDLGLAGGVAYNSVLNGKIVRETPFRRVFVQPAAGDSGTAIGVCYQIWNDVTPAVSLRPRRFENSSQGSQTDSLHYEFSPFTGPEFSDSQIETELQISNLRFQKYSDKELMRSAARDIADGLVVGWFQGRTEFGPRALGNRSILADPRRAEMKDLLNERIKRRESFRPFAPSILAEFTDEYFEQSHPSPGMLMVYEIKPERRGQIPAVTHIDGTGRLQTVTREANTRFYDLIAAFHQLTGVPLVLNTSFNENEPMVCTPRDAVDCFLKTRIDVLYLGNFIVRRAE
jgi:carbamoyltransferase